MLLTGWEFLNSVFLGSYVLSACVPLIYFFFLLTCTCLEKGLSLMLTFWGCTSQRIFSFLRAFAPPVLQMQMNTVYSHNSSHLGKVFIVRAIFLWQFQHRRICSLLYFLQSHCPSPARAGVQCPLFPFPLMANFSPVFTLHELLGGTRVCFDGAWPESLVLLIPRCWSVCQEDYKSTWSMAFSSSLSI